MLVDYIEIDRPFNAYYNTHYRGDEIMIDNFTCPVIVEYVETKTKLIFPTFDNLITEISDSEDYIKAAQDVIALQILDAEDAGLQITECLNVDKISITDNQRLVYVNVWMPYHRTMTKTVYTRKNVTIPVWLNQLAKASGVNFSEVLTEALKQKLT